MGHPDPPNLAKEARRKQFCRDVSAYFNFI
jgi:hypothetical protein